MKHICEITKPDGSTKQLKNLGYVFRNWQRIDRFQVEPMGDFGEFLLSVYFKDGSVYRSDYASFATSVRLFWFRPTFYGGIVRFVNCAPNGEQLEPKTISQDFEISKYGGFTPVF